MPSLCSARPTEPLLHIAYVTEACPPEVDGVTMAVARALRPLRAAGHRVRWVRQRGEAALCCAVEGRSTGTRATTATATTEAATTDTTTATLLRPA